MMIRRVLKYGFYQISIEKALFDPSKHGVMDRKSMPLTYESVYDIGKYPEVYLNYSIAPRHYESQIQTDFIKILKQNYQSVITRQLLRQKSYRTLSRFLKKDAKTSVQPQNFIADILRSLSKSIIVKQSRFTWPIEQKMRLQLSFKLIQESEVETIEDFFVFYNEVIEHLVLVSTLGYSPFINQQGSAIEKLNQVEPKSQFTIPSQHLNPINKLLVLLHE